jgi:hypothetical protein
MMPKFLLTHGSRGVNFIAKNQERHFRQFLDGEKCVEFGFRLSEAFEVSAVHKKDNSVDLREVITPQTAS